MTDTTIEDLYLKEGYVVWIDEPLSGFYRVVRREPFDYETGQESVPVFSTYNFGASTGFKAIQPIEPDDKPLHLYYVLWGVLDENQYYVKLPAGQNRFGIDTNKEIGFINVFKSPMYDMDPTYAFWIINEWYPSIQAVITVPMNGITPKIWFKGMKYDIELIEDDAIIQAIKAGRIPHRRVYFGGIKNTP